MRSVRYMRAALVMLFSVSTLFAAPWSAEGQGFGLYEQGACAMGRAGAGVAAPCDDGSAIFFNPAGLALTTRTVISGGGTAIAPRGQFTDSTTGLVSVLNPRTFPAPSAYFATPLGPRFVIGAGLFAPYGLTTDWPTTSEGRYIAYKSSLHSIYVQPTIALRVTDRILVGGGVDITWASIELRRRADLSTVQLPGAPAGVTFGALGVPAGTDFADVPLTGSGTHVGAHVGVILKPTDRLSFGGRYLTRQHIDVTNGTLAPTQVPTGLLLAVPLPGIPAGTPIDAILARQFTTGQPLSAQSASTSIPLPDQLVLGAAFEATAHLKLFADYQFTHWSLFDQLVIQSQFAPQSILSQNDNNTHGVRVGAEYALGGPNSVIIRGGFDGHTAAEPDQSVTPILPEAPRREYAAGVTIPLARHVRVDFAYLYVDQSDRAGRTVPSAAPTPAQNNGVYQYHANLFGTSLVVGF